jgi:hypothetical protein
MDALTSWGLLVFAITQIFIIIKLVAPGFMKDWQKKSQDVREHHQTIETSRQEIDRFEVLQTLHNQTYRDEQATIVASNQQELITVMVDALINEIKTSIDVHAMQLSSIKKAMYDNQEMIREIRRELAKGSNYEAVTEPLETVANAKRWTENS